jgi:hypothetical protein
MVSNLAWPGCNAGLADFGQSTIQSPFFPPSFFYFEVVDVWLGYRCMNKFTLPANTNHNTQVTTRENTNEYAV